MLRVRPSNRRTYVKSIGHGVKQTNAQYNRCPDAEVGPSLTSPRSQTRARANPFHLSADLCRLRATLTLRPVRTFLSGLPEDLELISEPYCPVCGFPYITEIPKAHLCGDCLAGIHYFDRARSTGSYRGSLREVLHRFKYGGQASLARPLAQMLTAPGRHLALLHKIDRVIPVPLHPKRLRQRGFNQASLLAKRLGSALKISVDYASLQRSRWTEPQTGLSRRQRAANVKGAFRLKRCEVKVSFSWMMCSPPARL
jgi:ComF family protein